MKKKIIVFVLLAFGALNAFAISEINYQKNFDSKIIPFLSSMKSAFFQGQNHIAIHYRTFLQPRAKTCLVVLPGRSEPIEKYAELVFDLVHKDSGKDLNIFLMDHRGQGSSERLSTPLDLGYVDNFSNYIADVETFVKLQKLDQICEHKFLLAHSLGAGIGVGFILKHPHVFDRVAIISPMLKILTKPYSYNIARAIVDSFIFTGHGAQFALGQKGFNPNVEFENNTVTSSRERFFMSMGTYEAYPETKLGGVSNKWIHEVMVGTNAIRSRYHEIDTPLRVFHAGHESFSETSEMKKICDEARDCKRFFYPSAKHEILMEKDQTRDGVIDLLNGFFSTAI
ncbi:MAG: alpha/beta fold hydrolase [Bacteriovorax sp.]|nr:alpha/beta fold hydrolase [Bacteriovorax sp.]